MSKTTLLVVCAFAGAILLGTTTTTTADLGHGIPDRVAALEAAVTALTAELATHDHDRDYARTPGEAMSIVRGVVLASGVIISGDGFSVSYLGSGTYQVTFDAGSFSGGVAPVVQALGPNPALAVAALPVNKDGFRVRITTGGQQSFRFIVAGTQ